MKLPALQLRLMLIILFVGVTLVAAQCGPSAAPESAAPAAEGSAPKIMVMEPWSRPSPLVAGNGAIYMILMNEGGTNDTLVSVESGVAEAVELHQTKMEGDVMRMSPVPMIKVPAGGSASLEPGGLHVMLINLKEELVPGEKIELTLNFEKSGPMTVQVDIREVGEAMGTENMEHEDMEDSN